MFVRVQVLQSPPHNLSKRYMKKSNIQSFPFLFGSTGILLISLNKHCVALRVAIPIVELFALQFLSVLMCPSRVVLLTFQCDYNVPANNYKITEYLSIDWDILHPKKSVQYVPP